MSTEEAIAELKQKLPGWWFSVGVCSLTAHASIGPDRNWEDAALLEHKLFDEGFHSDLRQPATIAEALLDCIEQGVSAKAWFDK